LLIASFVVAGMFILQSGFRRRLLWSIRVTLAIYAAFFILRLVVWPFIEFDLQIFVVLGGLAMASVVIWMLARWLTDRYVRSRPKQPPPRTEVARAWRSLFTRRG
jgi:hypothetical protein